MRGLVTRRVLRPAARLQRGISRPLYPLLLSCSRDVYQRRRFIAIHPVLLPPVVFGGLLIALWSWKCFMMVLFQNKIIYMPGLPPNARKETLADYRNKCGGIEWREESTTSADGTNISLCVASVEGGSGTGVIKEVYIMYFQGNASSLPPRLPFLSPVLRILMDARVPLDQKVRYTMVCCSYRGYWTSKGRPSEHGIALDAQATLRWIQDQDRSESNFISVVIWGQSIGAGVATNLAAQHVLSLSHVRLKALVLETPFLSVRAMLETLYPQKWLPYRYLWPFLWNQLDSSMALGLLAERTKKLEIASPKIVLLEAGRDELVPGTHGELLRNRCLELGLDVKTKVITGALHTEVMARQQGRLAVVDTVHNAFRD